MSFYTHDNTVDSPLNNFATFNPLNPVGAALSNGNLRISDSSSNSMLSRPTNFAFPNIGKWYAEFCFQSVNNTADILIYVRHNEASSFNALAFRTFSGAARISDESSVYTNSQTGAVSNGSIVGILVDFENNKVIYNENGQYSGQVPITSNDNYNYYFGVGFDNQVGTKTVIANFGQDHTFGGAKTDGGAYPDANGIGQFYYEPPEGALALCTANIPSGPINIANDDVPADYMKAVTWTGDSQNPRSITVGFQPDLIIAKRRNAAGSNWAIDSLRGKQRMLSTDTANSEDVNSVNGSVESFDLDGFSLKGTNTNGNLNNSGYTHVAWCWKAAGAPAANEARIIEEDGTLKTKTDGSQYTTAQLVTDTGATITPAKVSANRKSGFSIVKYVGTGSAATVPHGLSSAPEFFIVKKIDTDVGGNGWAVYHKSVNENYFLRLNDTNQKLDYPIWNDTAPSSNVITLGDDSQSGEANRSGKNTICYAWHSVPGYSKISSYVGNGSVDGPYVECGFRVGWLLIKDVDNSNSWWIYDSARDSSNLTYHTLHANDPYQEEAYTGYGIDLLSSGFKLRNGDVRMNGNSRYIFAAFSEQPFNAPATAR